MVELTRTMIKVITALVMPATTMGNSAMKTIKMNITRWKIITAGETREDPICCRTAMGRKDEEKREGTHKGYPPKGPAG